MNSKSENKLDRKHLVTAVGVGIAAITVIGITYRFSAEPPPGRVPAMPQVTIAAQAENVSLTGLKQRTEGFEFTAKETQIAEQLEALNLTESATKPPAPAPENLEHLISAMQKKLTSYAQEDLNRFLRLGDVLAMRFHEALMQSLRSPSTASPSRDAELHLMQAQRYGGSFVQRALDRGVISADGRLRVSHITPQVLFRYRWRHMGGVSKTEGFDRAELKALYDFHARFSLPKALERRLNAVRQLAALDKTYDETLATAVVLYEAGHRQEALETLEKAKKSGRDDSEIEAFVRRLNQ